MTLQRWLTASPGLTYPLLTFPLAFLALSSTPPVIPLTLLLTTLLLQVTSTANRSYAAAHFLLLIINLSVASMLANLSASTTALSSGASSFAISLVRGAFTAIVALIPIAIRSTVHRQALASTWLRATAFPLVWAASWMVMSRQSPVGRLGTWTPLSGGEEVYRWTRPFVGFAGVDFAVAAWAEVGASLFGQWIQGWQRDEEELAGLANSNGHGNSPPDDQESYAGVTTARPRSRDSTPVLAAVLLLLTVPSFFLSPLPLPAHSPDTTPLDVSCVLPPPLPLASPRTPLDQYLAETKALASRARVHLWPEGAVPFDTIKAREKAMKDVQGVANNIKVWIGMSFVEPDPILENIYGERLKRNGMALIGPDGELFEYFKRHLVPIAESYSQSPSNITSSLPLSTLPFPHPPRPKSEWHTYPRAIPITTSICLDFSQPLPSLPAHPSLILAPARTWHPSIGLAMAELANARAQEVGASVLWCDGGNGAVSGVYGVGRGAGLGVVQVGNGGSWLATVGLPYDEHDEDGKRRWRTMYAVVGDFGAILALVALVGCGYAVERSASRLGHRHGHIQPGGDGVPWGEWIASGTTRITTGSQRALGYIKGRQAEVDLLTTSPRETQRSYGTLVDVSSESH